MCVSSSGIFACPQYIRMEIGDAKGQELVPIVKDLHTGVQIYLAPYTTPTNITLEMTGYFLPLQTDSNTFKFSTVDDSATLSVGGATAVSYTHLDVYKRQAYR